MLWLKLPSGVYLNLALVLTFNPNDDKLGVPVVELQNGNIEGLSAQDGQALVKWFNEHPTVVSVALGEG